MPPNTAGDGAADAHQPRVRPQPDTPTASVAPTRSVGLDWPTTGGESRAIDIPQQLGPVTLLREIGRGGMGVVWLGHHELLHRQVAVKFLLANVADHDDPDLAQFLAGARAASAVKHLGLTAIFDANIHERVPYLVMHYVDGATLHQIIRAAGPMPAESAIAVMLTVADAVAALHDNSIIHRDIKPANVLVDLDGQAYVTDFGLTCLRGREGNRAAGTPAYMAPEMFDGQVSPRSDVFAMAVMLHEMLTGAYPFRATAIELSESRPPPIVLDRLRDIGADDRLIELIERGLNPDPVFRFKSASHFARALAEVAPASKGSATVLAPLVARALGSDPASTRERAESAASSSLYERLSLLAARKRDVPASPVAAPVIEQPAKPELEPGRLAQSVPCLVCEHDLRWQRQEGNCPECGNPVERSLFEDRLIFSDVGWLRKTSRWLLLLQLLLFGWVLVGPLSFWLLVRTAATFSNQTTDAIVLLSILGLIMLCSLVSAITFTAPERTRPASTRRDVLRRVARGAALWCLLLVVLMPLQRRWGRMPPQLLIGSFILMFIVLAGYAEQLRRRLTSTPGGSVGVLIAAAGLFLVTLLLPRAGNAGVGIRGTLNVLLGMLILFGPILFAWWLNRTRRALRNAIRLHVDRDALLTPTSAA
jgi:serine/threonine protein kinase